MRAAAQSELCRRWAVVVPHRERLVRIATSRIGNVHDAEDCAHEALMRGVQFEGLDEARVGAFLTVVTLRLCADHARQRERHRRLALRVAGRAEAEPPPDEPVCDRDAAAWVARHLAALPERQRQVLAAHADGMSCADVAAFYGLPFKAVESALHRARTRLRVVAAVGSG